MRHRGTLALIVVGCAFLLGMHGQTYFASGPVTAADSTLIVLNGEAYPLALMSKVVVQTERNGAFFEENGTPRDIVAGCHVTIHVNGNVVDQVIVERWRR